MYLDVFYFYYALNHFKPLLTDLNHFWSILSLETIIWYMLCCSRLTGNNVGGWLFYHSFPFNLFPHFTFAVITFCHRTSSQINKTCLVKIVGSTFAARLGFLFFVFTFRSKGDILGIDSYKWYKWCARPMLHRIYDISGWLSEAVGKGLVCTYCLEGCLQIPTSIEHLDMHQRSRKQIGWIKN